MSGLWISWQTRFSRVWHSHGLSGYEKAERKVAEQEPGWESSRTWREDLCFRAGYIAGLFWAVSPGKTLGSATLSLHHYRLDKNESKSCVMFCVSLLQIPRGLMYFGHICLEVLVFVGVVSFVAAQVRHSSFLWNFTENWFLQNTCDLGVGLRWRRVPSHLG